MRYDKYFPILEYYRKVVVPMNPKRYFEKGNSLVVCPLHDDHDPSLGIIHSSKDGEIFHCFGCGRWGNVVELHQGVMRRLRGRRLSYEESLRELCSLFSVDYSRVAEEAEKDKKNSENRSEWAIEEAISRFDISDFRELFLQGKLAGRGIGYFNNLMMVMVNELKNSEK